MSNKLILIFILLFPFNTAAQHFQLDGNIRDESREPLVAATVVVLSTHDSTHAAAGRTDTLGHFRLGGLPAGKYWFICSYLGYDPIQLDVELTGEPRTLYLGEIRMKSNTITLSTVQVVEKATPVIVRNDTIYYHAASFQTRPNAAVLDLLKKLPGIQVRADGTIMIQGKEVQNILVDGKPFFNDNKLPTRVLEAEAIETVEVYDETTKTADFTGVSDGKEEITINLVLKEDRKKGWFGEARTAGGGSGSNDLRYNTNLNMNRFTPVLRAGLNGSLSNTGNFGGGYQRSQNLNGMLSKSIHNNFETSQNADFVNDQQQAKRVIRQQIFLPGEVQNSLEENQTSNKNQHIAVSSSWSRQNDTLRLFNIAINANLNGSENSEENQNKTFRGATQQILGSRQSTFNKTLGHSVGNYVMWGRKLKRRGRVFLLSGNLNFSENKQEGSIFSANTFFNTNGLPEQTDTIRQTTNQKSYTHQQGFNFSFTEPLGKKHLFQIEYDLARLSDRTTLNTFDKQLNGEILNDSLSNEVKNNTLEHLVRTTLQFHLKKWQLDPGLVFQHSELQTNRNLLKDTVSKIRVNRLMPSLHAERPLGNEGSFDFTYDANQTTPNVAQLQAIPDRTDPLNVRMGNPGLRPEFRHHFGARANQFLPKKQISFFGSTDLAIVTNKIIETITIDSNLVRYFRPQNGGSEWVQNLRGSISFDLKKLFLNVSLSGDLEYGKSQALINNVNNKQKTRIFGQEISFNFSPKDWFSANAGVGYQQNLLNYSVSRDLNQRFFNQNISAGAFLLLPKRWTLNSDFNMEISKGRTDGFNQKIPIWNCSLSKIMLAGDRLEISLNAFDLLNRNVQIKRTTQLNYVRDEQANILSRYFMLGMVYRLMAQ